MAHVNKCCDSSHGKSVIPIENVHCWLLFVVKLNWTKTNFGISIRQTELKIINNGVHGLGCSLQTGKWHNQFENVSIDDVCWCVIQYFGDFFIQILKLWLCSSFWSYKHFCNNLRLEVCNCISMKIYFCLTAVYVVSVELWSTRIRQICVSPVWEIISISPKVRMKV